MGFLGELYTSFSRAYFPIFNRVPHKFLEFHCHIKKEFIKSDSLEFSKAFS